MSSPILSSKRSRRTVLGGAALGLLASALPACSGRADDGGSSAAAVRDASLVAWSVETDALCGVPVVSDDGRALLLNVCRTASSKGRVEHLDLTTLERTLLSEYDEGEYVFDKDPPGFGVDIKLERVPIGEHGWFGYALKRANGVEVHAVRTDRSEHRVFEPSLPDGVPWTGSVEIVRIAIAKDASTIGFQFSTISDPSALSPGPGRTLFVGRLTGDEAPAVALEGIGPWAFSERGPLFLKAQSALKTVEGPALTITEHAPPPLAYSRPEFPSLLKYADAQRRPTFDGRSVIAVEEDTLNASSILIRHDLTGGTGQILDTGRTVRTNSLMAAGDFVIYPLVVDDDTYQVRRVPRSGGAPEVLLSVTTPGVSRYGDATLEWASADGRVVLVRMGVDSGIPGAVPVVHGSDGRIHDYEDGLYWLSDGGLKKLDYSVVRVWDDEAILSRFESGIGTVFARLDLATGDVTPFTTQRMTAYTVADDGTLWGYRPCDGVVSPDPSYQPIVRAPSGDERIGSCVRLEGVLGTSGGASKVIVSVPTTSSSLVISKATRATGVRYGATLLRSGR